MIKIDGKEIILGKFPDGTPLLKPDIDFSKYEDCKRATLTWHFESNEEMVAVMFLTRHLQRNGILFIDLVMPYIPNARQDRVKGSNDVFTLKYFAEFINELAFDTVTVLDPHSSVSEALIDNIIIENPKKYINKTMASIGGFALTAEDDRKPLMAFYPDEGAMKRYSGLIPMAYAFGIKKRDWESGKIQVMYEICYAKFTQNPRLAEKLVATGDEVLIEGNTWNDKFWGVCNGEGMNHLGKILMAIRTELGFDAPKVKDDIVNWIRDFFEQNGKDCNAVIGISGGKDSSVVAALCVEALGKDRVIGVLMPNGVQDDIEDSIEVVEHLGIPFTQVNIFDGYNGVIKNMETMYMPQPDGSRRGKFINISRQTVVNLPPRIRMATLYAISQSVNGRVANTCNLSEDWIGYSTRWGDSVGDFSPLANLTSDEVIAVGIECGLPEELVYKTPSDGLCGMTDEDNFGFTYKVLNRYIRTGYCFDAQTKESIDNKHKKNLFKLQPIPAFGYKNTSNQSDGNEY